MERKLRDGNVPLRRRHMGLAGAIIIISQVITQYFSSSHSNKNISEELLQMKINQEKYFVKKEELEQVSSKIDKMRKDLADMNDKIRFIKRYVSSEEKNRPLHVSLSQ
jgi:Ser-tRNA(Ala) deacylase AlaX